jgi:hypothetical protein
MLNTVLHSRGVDPRVDSADEIVEFGHFLFVAVDGWVDGRVECGELARFFRRVGLDQPVLVENGLGLVE